MLADREHSTPLAAGTSIAQLYQNVRKRFRNAGIETADLDARVLICAIAGVELEQFIANPERAVSNEACQLLDDYCARRELGEPVARILGVREFWSLPYALNEATLVPRPDTEILVEAAIEILRGLPANKPRIADLGTGSGCILISILHACPDAAGIGVDISERALIAARSNAKLSGVAERATFQCGSWVEPLEGWYDMVVANPPYIPTGELARLPAEVSGYDPSLALDGGPDGLEAYREIAKGVSKILKSDGAVLLEVGQGQAEDVAEIMRQHDFSVDDQNREDGANKLKTGFRKDLAGINRVVVCRKNSVSGASKK